MRAYIFLAGLVIWGGWQTGLLPGGFLGILFFTVMVPTIASGLAIKFEWYKLATSIGAAMNGLVVCTNGGYMPVVGWKGEAGAIWVIATDEHRLLWLADRTSLWGFSPGDIVLLGGLFFLGIVPWLAKSVRGKWQRPRYKNLTKEQMELVKELRRRGFKV